MVSDSEDDEAQSKAKRIITSDDEEEPGPSNSQKEVEEVQAPQAEEYDSDEGVDRNA